MRTKKLDTSKDKFLWTQKPDVQKVYTTQEIADVLGTTATVIRNITSYYNIEHSIQTTGNARAAFYSYDSMRLIKQYYEAIQKKADMAEKNKLRLAFEKKEADSEKEQHPLVTDERFLKLSYFPEVVPNCFED